MRYPEMVKPNHRHRGPMETRKNNNSVRDISISIARLKEQFGKIESRTATIQSNVYTRYNEDMTNERQLLIHDILTVRGGEL